MNTLFQSAEENKPKQRKQMAGNESLTYNEHLLQTRDNAVPELYCR
jgi:hypothetical protein